MPLYKMRHTLEAKGVKAFWKIEAGLTRGPVPEAEDHQERIEKLQQELHGARQEVKKLKAENLRLRGLRQQKPQQKPSQEPKGSNGSLAKKVGPEVTGLTLPIPPRDMGPVTQARNVEGYLRIGGDLKDRLVHYTGVEPTSSILDIGAGPGRVARHFVDFVEPPGRYVGMDIEKPNMDWCEENISAANPAFNFFHQDVYNGLYNPEGKYKASEYGFPFRDESFDLIFLTSVFTHLVPEDVQNYLNEISRLLKPDGYCFCTWFLLGHDLSVKYMGPHSKEARVGYGFRHCLEMLEKSRLTLVRDPVLGIWRGTDLQEQNRDLAGNQDILLLRRADSGERSLVSRYEAPALPEKQSSEPGEVGEIQGTIKLFDPVSSTIVLETEAGKETLGVPAESDLRINDQSTDSALLRQGQRADIRFLRDRETGNMISQYIRVTDKPGNLDDQTQRVVGTLEALNLERGLITLIVANSVRTFELDPRSVEAYSGKRRVDMDDLRIGQGIVVEQLGDKKTIRLLNREAG